jgi:hypothetical protein
VFDDVQDRSLGRGGILRCVVIALRSIMGEAALVYVDLGPMMACPLLGELSLGETLDCSSRGTSVSS